MATCSGNGIKFCPRLDSYFARDAYILCLQQNSQKLCLLGNQI